MVLYWAGNNILAEVDSIQLGINLYLIPAPPNLQSKWTIESYNKKQNISQVYNQKYRNYDLTSYLKTCFHISFQMLGPFFSLDCRYLRYLGLIDWKVEKKIRVKKSSCCWHTQAWFVDHGLDIHIWLNVRSNMTINDSFVISMTFLSTRADLIQYYVRSHDTFSLVTQDQIIHLYTSNNFLFYNKLMKSHELIVIYIIGWIEYEPSHTFITPTDNWTWKWFDAHIYRNDTILLIFLEQLDHCKIVLV